MNRYPEFAISLPEGHPVKVYFTENNYIKTLLNDLNTRKIEDDYELYYNLYNEFCQVEKKFARKENQLFPYLETNGWFGPSQGMWAFHDQIREMIKAVRYQIQNKNFDGIPDKVDEISDELHRLFSVEEQRLFPMALQLLKEDDWKGMREGDEEIGWMLKEVPPLYPAEEEYVHPSQDTKKRKLPFSTEDKIKLDEGYLNIEQINLLLRFMPVDLTYVDENDCVVFYNRGDDRVFPRSAGIIGREVRFCHPPKSVDTVLRILEEFKKGEKDEAEFWINFKSRMIHIRYFAIRDKEKNYKGIIEMSQDITDIQKLTGEQRLLSWD